MSIRVRIAPSPSGFLHIGTAKMALFNWLYARKEGGTFVLRLEDTDAERTDEQFVHAMCEGFQWLGIDWDEGPAFGEVPAKGRFGPYRQSQRRELYVKEALRLLEEGKAFKCFMTKEELEAVRQKAMEDKATTAFRSPWREATAEEIAAQGDKPYVVRFRIPEGETTVRDLVQGDVTTRNDQIDDFVILRGNGDPIFHLAVVVDDGTMEITHVIRGDDHLTNAARHVLLFEALGYPVPKMAHLPMVLDERGKKYSKREPGANVLDWRDAGYLPEALINYVALLGWTPEEEGRELFTLEELKEIFTISRWGKSAARFDRKKLDWLNGQHIRTLSAEKLRGLIVPYLEQAGFDLSGKSIEWLTELARVCQEKLVTLKDIVEKADFFFQDVTEYEEKAVQKQWMQEGAVELLEKLWETLAGVEAWNHDTLKAAYEKLSEESGVGLGKLVHPTRLALTGKSVGPGLFELTELLGKVESLRRIERAVGYVRGLGTSA